MNLNLESYVLCITNAKNKKHTYISKRKKREVVAFLFFFLGITTYILHYYYDILSKNGRKKLTNRR